MKTEEQPLFIVGVARSGTSYLHSLLNEHPMIRLSYESNLFLEGWRCYQKHQNLDLFKGFNTLLDKFISMEGEEKNSWLTRIIQKNRKKLFEKHCTHRSFSLLIRDIFNACGHLKCFGNKMLRAELCPDILKIWPNAVFIILIRDPRAVVSSQIKRFKGRRLQYAAIYCDIHFKWTFQYAAGQGNYLIVPYETFIQNPLSGLKQILELCGTWDSFHAGNMLTQKPVFSKPTEKWRKNLTPRQVKQIETYCYNSMKKSGYQPELAFCQKKISVIEKLIEIGFEKREAVFYSPEKLKQKNILNRISKMIRL